MAEACTKSIICPNKQLDPIAKFTEKGNLLESETYIGGKVECLETGVYRSDIEYKFDMKPEGFQSLIDNVDRDMTFAIEVEGGMDRRKITNYDEVSFIRLQIAGSHVHLLFLTSITHKTHRSELKLLKS
jgi:DNA polymerase epsilon subunit 1